MVEYHCEIELKAATPLPLDEVEKIMSKIAS